jgi:hypothetical protein
MANLIMGQGVSGCFGTKLGPIDGSGLSCPGSSVVAEGTYGKGPCMDRGLRKELH